MALNDPFSVPIKETILPPTSSTSPHSHPLSPRILTPEMTEPPVAHDEAFSFAKQPIHKQSAYSIGIASAPTSSTGTDSEAGFGEDGMLSDGNRPPVSLLTALLHSQDKTKSIPAKRPPPSSTGIASTKSSLPSTAFSSPTGAHHGILQNPPPHPILPPRPTADDQPTSILRRGSVTSSDGGEVLGLGIGTGITGFSTLHHSEKKLDPVEEKREKIEWADEQPTAGPTLQRAPSATRPCALKFTVAQAPVSTQSSDSGEANAVLRRTNVKRDAAGSGTSSPVKRPSSPFAKERVLQRHMTDDEPMDEQEQSDVHDDEEEDESSDASEEVALPGYRKNSAAPVLLDANMDVSDSEESDLGYQEDEEDGAFSDEDEVAGIFSAAPSAKFPFARPTNYRRKRKGDHLGSPTPPPAPAAVLPPMRRGRGHIRVAETTEAAEPKKGCTRHCSPPPARSRAGSVQYQAPPAASSPSARKLSLKRDSRRPSRELALTTMSDNDRSVSPRRSSDAGPREGRAGSPMPEHILRSGESDTEEDEDEDAEQEQDDEEEKVSPAASVPPPSAPFRDRERGGWRSDDSMFYGPTQQTRGMLPLRVDSFNRNTSAPPARNVFESDGEEQSPTSVAMEQSTSMGDGVRNFFRRASEHLPMFRRPSITSAPSGASDDVFVDISTAPLSTKKDSTPMSVPMLSQATMTCPPALDNTPAQAFSSTLRSSHDLDLTSRLEQTLSANPQPSLTRSSTTPGKVTFKTNAPSMSTRPSVDSSATAVAPNADLKRPSLGSTVSADEAVISPSRRAERVRPIACPTSSCAKDAAQLGWTDEALRKIRRNAGKVE